MITTKSKRTLVAKQTTFELAMIQGQVKNGTVAEKEEEGSPFRVDAGRERGVKKYRKVVEKE